MKKLLAIITIIALMGCSMIEFKPDAIQANIKMAAMIAGERFAAHHSDLAPVALAYAKSLEAYASGTLIDNEKLVNELWPAAVKNLLAHVSDPVVKSIMQGAAGMVQLHAPNVSIGTQAQQIRYAVQGFIEGVEMGTKELSPRIGINEATPYHEIIDDVIRCAAERTDRKFLQRMSDLSVSETDIQLFGGGRR